MASAAPCLVESMGNLRYAPSNTTKIVHALAMHFNPIGESSYWQFHHSSRRWMLSDKLRRATGLDVENFDRTITKAEALGLVRVERKPKGLAVSLERLAIGTFSLAERSQLRRLPNPESLAGLPHADLLLALATFRSSTPLAESLALAVGRDVEAVWDDCLDAERLGLVDLWPDHPIGPKVTLSAMTSGRLGLALSDDGSAWLYPGEIDRTRTLDGDGIANETDRSAEGSCGIFSEMADPEALDGIANAIIGETADERWAATLADHAEEQAFPSLTPDGWEQRSQDAADASRWPRPQTILGVRRVWPVMVEVDGNRRRWTPELGPCPECDGRRMSVTTLCLVCLRSGADALLLTVDPKTISRSIRDFEAENREAISRAQKARKLAEIGTNRAKPTKRAKKKRGDKAKTLKGGLG